MNLQIRSLPRDKRVCGAVRLVEAVVRKMRQQLENPAGQFVVDSVLSRPGKESFLFLHQKLRLLMPHGATQDIRLAERKARQHLHNLHDLLLVEHDAEGLFQDRFQKRMQIGNLLFPLAAVDKILHHAAAQRTGPIQRHRGNQVFKAFRRQVLDELRHTRRFHLEYGAGLSLAKHPRRRLVHGGNIMDVYFFAASLFDIFDRIGDDRKRPKAEKIHLQKAQFFDEVFIKGRHQRPFGYLHRHIVRQGIAGNHDARRMRRRLARQAFDFSRKINHAPHARIRLVQFPEIRRILQRLVQRDAKLRGNQFRHLVGVGIREA